MLSAWSVSAESDNRIVDVTEQKDNHYLATYQLQA